MSTQATVTRDRAKSVDAKSGVQVPNINGIAKPPVKKAEGQAEETKPKDETNQTKDESNGAASGATNGTGGAKDGTEAPKDNGTTGGEQGGEAGAKDEKGETKDEKGNAGASPAPPAKPPVGASRLRLVELVQGEKTTEKVLCRPPALETGITLATVRRRLTPWITRTHKFCYPDLSGEDEATTLADYLALARSIHSSEASGGEAGATASSDAIYVYKPEAAPSKAPASLPTAEKPDLGKRLELGNATADKFESRDRAFFTDELITGGMLQGAKHASALSVEEWDVVLRNCGAMYGWYINHETNSVERARKPAFQLRRDRSKLQPSKISVNSTVVSVSNMEAPTAPESASREEKTKDPNSSTDTVAAAQATPAAKSDALADQASLEGSQLMDQLLLSQQTSAGKDIQQEVEKLADGVIVKKPAPAPAPQPAPVALPPPPPPPPPQLPLQAKSSQATFELPGSLTNDALPIFNPDYHVNDDSMVEVFIITNEMQESMAKNDFSAHSTEASVSGGFGGYGGSVSGGYAASKASSTKSSSSSFQKTMVAKYKYPRATVSLEPRDLEPSPELYEALLRLQRTKSVIDMRRLHREFGHLFCRRVTVGGRLLSTKIMTSTETKKEQSEKEEFKASVSVSVTTPYVSGSAKHEQSGGSSNEQNTGKKDSSERHAFEAVGGDTILSNNPPAWAQTCSIHSNWRVIDRVALTPMADAISELPGMGGIKTLFAQAVPTLSRAIELPEGGDVQVRLRLSPRPNQTLSMPFPTDTAPSYYLGHEENALVTPIAMVIRSQANFWVDIVQRGTTPTALFSPKSYRAPAIYGFAARNAETSSVANSAKELVSTVWELSAPFDNYITHQCRVILRMKPKPLEGFVLPKDLSLAVFRNQQGVFLPCMSDDENPQIFRILKEGAQPGATISEDDVVRLSWDVNDQAVGYRDFSDDAFGRRRTASSEPMPLYFKLPWPRFETIGRATTSGQPLPNNLVMSSSSDLWDTKSTITTVPDIAAAQPGGQGTYMLQDCQFRLNVVGVAGREESDNYMLGAPRTRIKIDEEKEPEEKQAFHVFQTLWGMTFLVPVPRK